MTYFGPALDPSLGGSERKTTTLVRDLKYFMHTKFHQNPSSGSEKEVENVNFRMDDGRRTDSKRRTTRLLFPKNDTQLHVNLFNEVTSLNLSWIIRKLSV